MNQTDQLLRQQLVNYGETVPPITARNREQLRARLEQLRARPCSPVKSSPSRSRENTSTARSRPIRGLIELSDSETDTSANEYLSSRRNERETNIPTRSTVVGRSNTDRTNSTPLSDVTVVVEQSIARHRREIQQLIDSARDRALAANANISSNKYESPPSTSSSIRSSSKVPARFPPTVKTDVKKLSKQSSWFYRSRQTVGTFWKNNKYVIGNIFKALFVGIILAIGLIFLKNKINNIIPQPKKILCTPENAIECDDMVRIVNVVRKYLQIRTGEVDCGFRSKSEIGINKSEINRYLDAQGFKFEVDSNDRWKTLITYIFDKPVDDILVMNNQNLPATDIDSAYKLTSTEGIHSFVCRARRTINSTMQHLAWIGLGTAAFLVLGWFIRRRSRQYEDREKTYKNFIDKIIELLETQYEEHLQDPEVKPWLAVSHIRDMLIPTQDRKRLKVLWERVKQQISEHESRIRAESQLIHGEEFEVWRWIQPRSPTSPSPGKKRRNESPTSPNEDSYVYMPPDVGLTQCLKLRNFFDSNALADDDEIDLVVDSIQNRCATVKRIEHIGIHSIFVYLKFSSKEAAAQGFHFLNNWKYHGREIIAKYLRLERYHEHFPEARDSGSTNN